MWAIAPTNTNSAAGKGPEAALVDTHAPWYAIWTHSHCEQLVNDQLSAKGFELFFPRASASASPSGQRRAAQPLFPGYLFMRHDFDKGTYVEVIKARGVVRVLGERWDALASIPGDEIDALQRVLSAGTPVLPHPHLAEGDRVRITTGPLTGVCGVFLRRKPARGLLVLSIQLLQRSVAVEIAAELVEAR